MLEHETGLWALNKRVLSVRNKLLFWKSERFWKYCFENISNWFISRSSTIWFTLSIFGHVDNKVCIECMQILANSWCKICMKIWPISISVFVTIWVVKRRKGINAVLETNRSIIHRPDREKAQILKISSSKNDAAQKVNETLIKL